jgi:formate hydrogenlyase subunit 3/multisubunit Na+/H+ antiporter MnhD subunit
VSALSLILTGRRAATPVVYGACLTISLVLCLVSLLSIDQASSEAVLPLGLPWLGAHFRLDPLASTFLAIVNFGAASASLYALGYGRHEGEPARVLPFYPAFLAAMNLVVVADDAYSFLFTWELMSLASWALVMAESRDDETAHTGIVYLIRVPNFLGIALMLGLLRTLLLFVSRSL